MSGERLVIGSLPLRPTRVHGVGEAEAVVAGCNLDILQPLLGLGVPNPRGQPALARGIHWGCCLKRLPRRFRWGDRPDFLKPQHPRTLGGGRRDEDKQPAEQGQQFRL
jgi:hypothetical protein